MSTPLIVVTGAAGQLGRTLSQLWADSPIPQHRYQALDRSALDIGDPASISAVLDQLRPSIIVNAAAYTQVDAAESDSDSAHQVNAAGVGALAGWAARNSARLLHISTDFVFDGQSDRPYAPDHPTQPLGVYGASKLAGEQQVQTVAAERGAIIRTSWLYSEYGGNFVKTMLRLMAERDQLSVVDDQIGSPTSTHGLAALIFAMIRDGGYAGIYHWSDGGSISWCQFAREIQRQALEIGLLETAIPIHPIATSDYPTPARRPAYSVLDRSRAMAAYDCPSEDWKAQLHRVVNELGGRP